MNYERSETISTKMVFGDSFALVMYVKASVGIHRIMSVLNFECSRMITSSHFPYRLITCGSLVSIRLASPGTFDAWNCVPQLIKQDHH